MPNDTAPPAAQPGYAAALHRTRLDTPRAREQRRRRRPSRRTGRSGGRIDPTVPHEDLRRAAPHRGGHRRPRRRGRCGRARLISRHDERARRKGVRRAAVACDHHVRDAAADPPPPRGTGRCQARCPARRPNANAGAASTATWRDPIDEIARLVLAGGKRLRPAFCHWGYVGAGGGDDDQIDIDAGSALELMHAFALFHDDVMDDAATRRGQPTTHAAVGGRARRGRLGGRVPALR